MSFGILGELILGGLSQEQTVCSIEQGIVRLVSDYLDVPIARWRKQDGALPIVTYELAKNDYQHELEGPAGYAEATVDFHIWSHSYDDLAEIGAQLRSILDGRHGMAWTREVLTILHAAEFDEIQADVGAARPVYCRTQQFTVLYLD